MSEWLVQEQIRISKLLWDSRVFLYALGPGMPPDSKIPTPNHLLLWFQEELSSGECLGLIGRALKNYVDNRNLTGATDWRGATALYNSITYSPFATRFGYQQAVTVAVDADTELADLIWNYKPIINRRLEGIIPTFQGLDQVAQYCRWLKTDRSQAEVLLRIGRTLQEWMASYGQTDSDNDMAVLYEKIRRAPYASRFGISPVRFDPVAEEIAEILTNYGSIVRSICPNQLPLLDGKTPVKVLYRRWLENPSSSRIPLLNIGDKLRAHVLAPGNPDPEAVNLWHRIRSPGLASAFGIVDVVADKMDISPTTGMDYLRRRLSHEFFDVTDTDTFKDAHIQSVLENRKINAYIRGKVDWLLPGDTTLAGLVKNCSPYWAELVAVLVEAAERALGENDTTFPVTNVRQELEGVIRTVGDNIPFLELVVYSPGLLEKDRLAMWRIMAVDSISNETLGRWTNVKPAMINKADTWTPAYTGSLFDKLLVLVDQDKALRKDVIQAIRENSPMVKIPDFQRLLKDLFGKPVVAASVATPLNLPSEDQGWSAREFLAKLGIANALVEERLRMMEKHPVMFKLMPKNKWAKEIKSWDPEHIGMHHFAIAAALSDAGLIE
jgi:hypothetical protein